MKKYILIFIIGFSFISCEKEISYDSEAFKPKLVVNSFNSQDTNMTVLLGESSSLLGLSENPFFRGDVKILVLKDELLLLSDSVKPTEGKISLPFRPLLGSTYELQLSAGTLATTRAIDSVPSRVPSMNMSSVWQVEETNRVQIRINDVSGRDRYFLKAHYIGSEWTGVDSVLRRYSATFTASDKSFISNIRTVATSRSYALFTDDTWDGKDKNIELILPSQLLTYPDFKASSLEIELSILSPTMYRYYVDLQYNSNVYGGPLASVSRVEGNIDQGLGAFCFFTKTTRTSAIP